MTFAVPIRIAEAVKDDINDAVAGDLFETVGFTAVRSYADWDDKFESLSGLAVDVVYKSRGSVELESRGYMSHTLEIHVAVRQRFGPADRHPTTGRLLNASVDPLVTLLEEIYKHFAAKRNATVLSDETTAVFDSDTAVVHWVNQAKLRQGLFEGFVVLTFQYREVI
jgi:hypothetical protein